MKARPWQVLASRPLLERRWLSIHEQRIALPQGGEIEEFHLIQAPDWSAVLALTEEGQVVLVEQYRHGAERMSLELPAGVIDPGESPLEAAQRELVEETGYIASEWQLLHTVNTEPSRHTNRAHFYFASGARRAQDTRFDPSESIEVRLASPAELSQRLDAGEIVHGLHVGAILCALRRGLITWAE
jgi:8-oxo-dGTP pyrophosphatase MutT (NUDIX family)